MISEPSEAASGKVEVSVVIDAYNAARWISETIDSVLAQTYRDFEVIVVDDGSTDETPEVVSRYGNKVRYLRKQNGGAASARNAGIRAARGRYVAFVNHDDVWEATKLEKQMALFQRQPEIGWAYTYMLVFDSATGIVKQRRGRAVVTPDGNVLPPLLSGCFVPFSTTIVKKEVFDKVGGFHESEEYRHVDDWDMWLRVAKYFPVGFVPEPLVFWRMHDAQATQRMDVKSTLERRLFVLDKAMEANPELPRSMRRKAEFAICLNIGRLLLDREQRSDARGVFRRAIRAQPLSASAYVLWLASLVPRSVLRLLGNMRKRMLSLPEKRA